LTQYSKFVNFSKLHFHDTNYLFLFFKPVEEVEELKKINTEPANDLDVVEQPMDVEKSLEIKSESVKSDAATEVKPDAATEVKPDTATEVKPDAATEVEPDVATEVKEVKCETEAQEVDSNNVVESGEDTSKTEDEKEEESKTEDEKEDENKTEDEKDEDEKEEESKEKEGDEKGEESKKKEGEVKTEQEVPSTTPEKKSEDDSLLKSDTKIAVPKEEVFEEVEVKEFYVKYKNL